MPDVLTPLACGDHVDARRYACQCGTPRLTHYVCELCVDSSAPVIRDKPTFIARHMNGHRRGTVRIPHGGLRFDGAAAAAPAANQPLDVDAPAEDPDEAAEDNAGEGEQEWNAEAHSGLPIVNYKYP